ncbi:MAG: type III secretion system translocon subunit SctB [Kiritimatiellae bacterium]|nr:type III secretion system translocon subunit SctB [Kiritimatiellia bacterium]
MSMTVNNVGTINWQAVLDGVNAASGAEKISETNQSVTFTAEVNGKTVTVTMNIPDDLDLPGEVTPSAIDSLMSKLVEGDNTFSQEQLLAIKFAITDVYNQMASALSTTQSTSTGKVMFDLYKLMALLVEVAQSQRDAARDLRTAENQIVQNSIQAQADEQRSAAMVGLIVGVTCGVVSALVSAGMMVGQTVAFKSQMSTARTSGVDTAQNNLTMMKAADTSEHAQAQLAKVTNEVEPDLAHSVTTDIDAKVGGPNGPKATFEAAQQKVTDAQTRLDTAKQTHTDAKTAEQTALTAKTDAETALAAEKTRVGYNEAETAYSDAVTAKEQYLANNEQPDQAHVTQLENDIASKKATLEEKKVAIAQEEQNLATANQNYEQAQRTTAAAAEAETKADTALTKAKTELEDARADYRSALKSAADDYADAFDGARARKAPAAELKQAEDKMRMARAYANNELAKEGVTTATEHRVDLDEARMGVSMADKALEANLDYKTALHRINLLSGINGINTAIGNTLQSMTQSISGMISAEATRQGAETQKAQEQLDEMKDLFVKSQDVIDAAIQLMNAVAQAEAQSMRDAIQA